MLFEELLKKANVEVLSRSGSGDPDITGITFDSRKVKLGYVFISIPGTKLDGDAYIADALAKGAAAIISEKKHPELNVPSVQVKNVRHCTGYLGAALWNIDINGIKMIGITGTNGKTTITHQFQKLLEQTSKKEQVWMFGTIDFHIANKIVPATHTTPEAIEIFRCIHEENYSPDSIVMETSSHSLALDRISGLFYDVAVWTNLTQDHLDFHKTMENYYEAKKRLFTEYMKPDGVAVINIDDKWGKRLSAEIGDRKILTYGRDSASDVRIDSWNCSWDGCEVTIVHKGKRLAFHSSLRGFFNVYNMTALIAGAYGLGFSDATIQQAFSAVETVAGRMDRVMIDAPFAVIVDYAHTPDALQNILTTARPLTKGRLICVFGCGGDRDRTKRPVMGGVVAEHADEAIVTSDNPRSERPIAIIDEICAGIPLDFPHVAIPDRKSAIEVALKNAKEGDCIVIAGKGHEDYQEINGVKHHFNDKEIVETLYLQMGK
ncbi:MAG: UDP-N-acetylmuramoyl-L-alanyl-D-glutamate--2,6-diaminopimelate ligase [Fibrobacter sp.]|nr:UDP-N-acetylmuramoyl-L-alanyl-D-glutamate--2,6-diaminopimelate ligase [Fibrobacter sp.]